MAESRKIEYKIILLGDPGVGKTTFFLRVRDQEFVDTELRPSASIGVEDLAYEHEIGDSTITVYLNDTGGGERFRTLTSNFYRNASAAILMYSVEDHYTFENLQEWVENAQDAIDPDRFVWAVVGNKCDVPLEIEHDTILSLCEQLDTKLNLFTSAKTGENVKSTLDTIVEEVHRRMQQGDSANKERSRSVKIGRTTSKKTEEKSSCCAKN